MCTGNIGEKFTFIFKIKTEQPKATYHIKNLLWWQVTGSTGCSFKINNGENPSLGKQSNNCKLYRTLKRHTMQYLAIHSQNPKKNEFMELTPEKAEILNNNSNGVWNYVPASEGFIVRIIDLTIPESTGGWIINHQHQVSFDKEDAMIFTTVDKFSVISQFYKGTDYEVYPELPGE